MKTLKKLLAILVIFVTFISTFIYTTPSFAANENKTQTKEKPEIASEGAILIDSNTGKVLYGKNENEKLYPASTTKILTAILAIENCKLTDKITASYEAVMSIPSGYSNAAIQPGEILTAKELLDMFLIHSANEVGLIFAEHISGSVENFAKLMNQKAAQLGCKNTNFTNPSGIHSSDHYSTAYDMALIAKYCMKNETFRKIVSKVTCVIDPTEKYEKRFFRTTNDLIDPASKYYYENAIGIKTGFTSQAKYCLIAGSKKDNLELITVTLGSSSTGVRYDDTVKLFEYGFANYKTQKIATKNSVIEEIVVENGTKDTKNLSLLLKDDITGLTPVDLDLYNLKHSVKLNETISAPIAEGDVLGKVIYNIDDITYSSDLIADHGVEELNIPQLIGQIALALFVLFIFYKLIFTKKKSKRKNSKKKKSKNHKNYKKSSDSIYKFY